VGYFAVLKPADADEAAGFSITRCHINLWVLRSFIPGRRLLYFDLGLQISATGTQPVKAVELLLPFKVEDGFNGDQFRRCMDLYDTLFHPETAELVFGEPVTISGTAPNQILALASGAEFHPRHIDTAKVAATPDEPPRSSCYLVPLASPLAGGSTAYVRFRFRVFANRPLLTPRSVFGGVILDFRIADVRESRNRTKEASLRPRMVPINAVNFFAMLPDQYQLLTASSQPRNMRILETRAWSEYLKRVAYMHPSNTQLVYYWRSEADVEVSSDNPFRVFATYDRHLNKAKIAFWSVVGLLLVAAVVRSGWIPGITEDAIRSAVRPLLTFFGLLTMAGVITAARVLFGFAMNRFAKVRLAARWVERLLLGRRLGP
jgi:hypothetical protein